MHWFGQLTSVMRLVDSPQWLLYVLALTAGETHALQNLIYMASRGPLSDICLVSFSVLPKENDILFSLEKKNLESKNKNVLF